MRGCVRGGGAVIAKAALYPQIYLADLPPPNNGNNLLEFSISGYQNIAPTTLNNAISYILRYCTKLFFYSWLQIQIENL